MASKKNVELVEGVEAAPVATANLPAIVPTSSQAVATRPIQAAKQMEKTMTKTAEDLVSFGQGNVEAFTKAGQVWAAGVQELGKQVAATAQSHIDQTVATFKAITTAKSFKEAIDLQSTLARSTVEKAVADTGKLTDASLKLAEQTWAPLTARVTLAVETFGRTA
jgi:phasin family protein